MPVQAAALQNAQVVRTAAFAPSRESVLGRSAGARAVRPPDAVLNRAVVAKATPPAAPVPFAQRQQALAANPGQPLDAAAVSRIRAAQPAPVARPLVRQAADMPANAGRRPAPPATSAAPSTAGAPVNPPVYRGQPNIRREAPAAAEPAVVPQNERRIQRMQTNPEPTAPVQRPAPVPNPDRELQRQQMQQQRQQQRQEVQQQRQVQGGERRAAEPATPAPAEHKEAAKPDKKEKEEERRRP